ncbi:hypothetical protein [Methanocella arvoryzae]|nr:hypothetical protein [Methanocella arvoryzae]
MVGEFPGGRGGFSSWEVREIREVGEEDWECGKVWEDFLKIFSLTS